MNVRKRNQSYKVAHICVYLHDAKKKRIFARKIKETQVKRPYLNDKEVFIENIVMDS